MSDDERAARVTQHEAKLWRAWHDIGPEHFVPMVARELERLESLIVQMGGDPVEQESGA